MGNTHGLLRFEPFECETIDDFDHIEEERRQMVELEKRCESKEKVVHDGIEDVVRPTDDAKEKEVEKLKEELRKMKRQLEAKEARIKDIRAGNKARLREFKKQINEQEKSMFKLRCDLTRMERWRDDAERHKTYALEDLEEEKQLCRRLAQTVSNMVQEETFTISSTSSTPSMTSSMSSSQYEEERVRTLERKLDEAEEKLEIKTIEFENWQDVISEQIGEVYRNGMALDEQRREQIEKLEIELSDLKQQKTELMVELNFRFDFPL